MATPYQGVLLQNTSLAGYTTWRVGGLAKQCYKPVDATDLAVFLTYLPADEPLLYLGLGSNCLIRDKGFNGTVILTQGQLMGLEVVAEYPDKMHIRAGAGISCATMARFCARQGLEGGEFWAGIPGTMGGAIRMNAGCHGAETWSHVISIETLTRTGELRTRTPDSFEIAYRHVNGLHDECVVAATCELPRGEKEVALGRIKNLLAQRAKTQPIDQYNCGSVFRNPPGDFAARLIESCGLKGQKMGGACVSEKHANFIVNIEGQAAASDIESLITIVHDTVKAQTGVALIREVHFIGE